MDTIIAAAAREINPSASERREIGQILGMVKKAAGEVTKSYGVSYVLSGSYIRDTWTRDKKEFDLFIMFPESLSREELEKQGLEIGKRIAEQLDSKAVVAYAEHPYVRTKVEEYSVDIVPSYKVQSAEQIKSSVDRTPFHNKFLLNNLKPSMSLEVRLLKHFLKSSGLYGSDAKTQGFSGYLCELLILRFGSFKNLIKSASDWDPGLFIALGNASEKVFHHPLVVLDPVDRNRNVAAVLSPENFIKFISVCKAFINKPHAGFFRVEEREISLVRMKKIISSRGTLLLGLTFRMPDILHDILYPQMRKCAKRLRQILEDNEFKITGSEVWGDSEFSKGKCAILLDLEVWSLPHIRKVVGPPVFAKNDSGRFIKKYKPIGRVWVDGNNWVAEFKREFKSAGSLLEHFLKDSGHNLLVKGIPKNIAESMKVFSILKNAGIVSFAGKNPGFAYVLEDYLTKKMEI